MSQRILEQQLKIDLYKFYMQVGLSVAIFAFAAINLSSTARKNRGNEALYASLLTGVFTYWMPSPGQKKEGDQVAIESEETNVFPNNKQDKN